MSDSNLNVRETDDPFYTRQDNHSVSGRGVFCPGENAFFDPTKGSSTGDECPLCGETVNV